MVRMKRYNEPELRDVKTLDEDIEDIMTRLTDDYGYQLEVLHQNSYSTYALYYPDMYFGAELSDFFEKSDNLKSDEEYIRRVVNTLERQSHLTKGITEEITTIRNRILTIPGLVGFDLSRNMTLKISFNHKPQGYKNIGSVILVGNNTQSRLWLE